MQNKIVTKKLSHIGLALVLTCSVVLSQPVSGSLTDLLTGEGYAANTNSPGNILLAKQHAMTDLANQIQSKVVSSLIYEVTENSNSLQEYITSKVNLISEMEISGVRWEVDKDGEFITARAILNKYEGLKLYRAKLNHSVTKINEAVKTANELILSSNHRQALKELFNASMLFNRYEQDLIIYLVLGGEELNLFFPQYSRAFVDAEINKLTETKFSGFNDAINGLCFQIAEQLDENARLIITPFNFEDTDWGSEFSNYAARQLMHGILEYPRGKTVSIAVESEITFNDSTINIIRGNYWLKNDLVELLLLIYNANGTAKGSARVNFPVTFLDSLHIAYQPQNFIDAMTENKYFTKDEIVYGSLKLDFWTNKGNRNLIFQKDEKMKLYVRVNTPAYIRFIYHLANGIRTPLYENYYIDETKVNKTIELPDEFVCTPPFGVEKLQIFASSEPFPELNTKNIKIAGEQYTVLVEDLPDFLTVTRGFLKNKNQEIKSAERVITITTVE